MAKKNNITYATEYMKIKAWNRDPNVLYRHMECKVCGAMTQVCEDTTAVTCNICVNQLTEPPTIIL